MNLFEEISGAKTFRLKNRLKTDYQASGRNNVRSSSRNVRFSEQITHNEGSKKKHHSASILKKTRFSSVSVIFYF